MKDDSMVWTLGIAQINCVPYHDERPEGLYSFLPGRYHKPTLMKKKL